MKKEFKNYINNDHNFDRKTLFSIFALIIVFAGFFGFIYEFIFYYFNSGMKAFYWRGGNFLPWINIYATGSILIYLLTYKHRKKMWKVFFIALVSTFILELLAGVFMDIIRHGQRCWDYDSEIWTFGNIGGYVCLRSALFFAFSGLLLMYFIVPTLFYMAKRIDKKKFFMISVVLFSIVMFDELYNLIFARILSLPRASDIYKTIGFKYMEFKK